MTVALAVGLGALIGVLLGLLGGGGSILAVPALVYGLSLGVEQAIPISLAVVAASSAVGVVPKVRAGQVQWRIATVFSIAGIPAAVAGSAVGRHLPPPVVMSGFALMMIAAAVAMLRDRLRSGTACTVGESGVNWRRCMSRSIPAGLLVGFLTGLFGVGGGFLIVPALVIMLGVEMAAAVGTSLVIIMANSLSGLASHLGDAGIDWPIAVVFLGAAMAGSLIAGMYGGRVDTARLRRWFAVLVLGVAVYVLARTIFGV